MKYDEHLPEEPYMVLAFPFAWFETAVITYDQFLARTLIFVIGLILICSLFVIVSSATVALLWSGFWIFLYYIVWRYGRREAQRRNLGL